MEEMFYGSGVSHGKSSVDNQSKDLQRPAGEKIPEPTSEKKEAPKPVPNPEVEKKGKGQGIYDVPDSERIKKPEVERSPHNTPNPAVDFVAQTNNPAQGGTSSLDY